MFLILWTDECGFIKISAWAGSTSNSQKTLKKNIFFIVSSRIFFFNKLYPLQVPTPVSTGRPGLGA